MKIPRADTLVAQGAFARSSEWEAIRAHIHKAVCAADWPPGSGSFTIYPESGKKRGEGNGVKPIKDEALRFLTRTPPPIADGRWVTEHPWPVGERVKPGKMDAAFLLPGDTGLVAFEWETGNISSSHRSINKVCLGLLSGRLKAGVVVVPSRALYPYLTDRIGNIAELEPYFPLWQATPCQEGVMEVIVFEHDAVSRDVPRIPKGTDGRAQG